MPFFWKKEEVYRELAVMRIARMMIVDLFMISMVIYLSDLTKGKRGILKITSVRGSLDPLF